jgi:hypothetical protein
MGVSTSLVHSSSITRHQSNAKPNNNMQSILDSRLSIAPSYGDMDGLNLGTGTCLHYASTALRVLIGQRI